MRIVSLPILAAMLFVLAGTNLQAEGRHAPICFTNELAAFTNGSMVLTALRVADTRSKVPVESLIGSRVLFEGNNWEAPCGTNADLNLGNGVPLSFELNPQHDIRPIGRLWRAEVVGILESVDFEKRVVHIKALPEEWSAYWVR